MNDHATVESGDPNDRTYWFNVNTGDIEHGRVSPGPDRLGPFTTREDAERAPEIVRARAELWKHQEAKEDDW